MMMNNKLVQNLIDLGVHIGTDLSRGYNRQYNEYIISIIPYREKDFQLSINPRSVFDRGRTRRIPIIDLSKSIFFLKRAVSFIRGVSMNMGKLLLYHPTLSEHTNFLLVFARLVNRHKHAFLHRPWQYGTLTNYYFCFYTMIKALYDYDTLKRRKKISFIGLFSRLLVYSYLNIPRDYTVEEHIQSSLKFWRAIVFLRYFRVFYAIPDVLITLNPTGAVGAIEESGQLGIPVVSTVDTNGDFFPVTYPLLSNDDSFSIAIYYFILFMNVYESGRVERYRSNMPDTNTDSFAERKKKNSSIPPSHRKEERARSAARIRRQKQRVHALKGKSLHFTRMERMHEAKIKMEKEYESKMEIEQPLKMKRLRYLRKKRAYESKMRMEKEYELKMKSLPYLKKKRKYESRMNKEKEYYASLMRRARHYRPRKK